MSVSYWLLQQKKVGASVAWGLSPSLVGLAQKTISQTRVPRVSFQRSSFVIAYLVCVTRAALSRNLSTTAN